MSGRVVVVEDDPTVSEVVARYLTRAGFTVHTGCRREDRGVLHHRGPTGSGRPGPHAARPRRSAGVPPPAGPAMLRDGSLSVDVGAHEVRLDDQPLALTTREYDLLYLLQHPAPGVLKRSRIGS
jgi:DNA-binding response OmpR family regulator